MLSFVVFAASARGLGSRVGTWGHREGLSLWLPHPLQAKQLIAFSLGVIRQEITFFIKLLRAEISGDNCRNVPLHGGLPCKCIVNVLVVPMVARFGNF